LCLLKLLSDNGLKTVEEGGTVTVTVEEAAKAGRF
jgi:NitT/TauT family transport system substrate-binding protein